MTKHTDADVIELVEIARKFVDAYPGNQAGVLGNGAARRALDEFRIAIPKFLLNELKELEEER